MENTMLALVVTLALGLLPAQESQEKKPVPKDSIELTVIGCLQGRILSTIDKRGTDVESSPYVGERTFRLNGNKDVTNEIKKRQKQLVEVVGLVKRSALDDKGVKSGRVSITGGSPVAGMSGLPTGVDNVPVMDVSAIRMRSTSCSP
jgi:hypothetical protein